MFEHERVEKIADSYGTPFYLISTEKLVQKFEEIKSSFPKNTTIAYATKANYTPSVIQTFQELGTNFDVFSPGELQLLRKNGSDLEKVIYTSVAETEREFEFALGQGVRRFVLGSINAIINFGSVASRLGIEDFEVMVRIQPLSEVKATVSTSGKKSKFGFTLEGEGDTLGNSLEQLDKNDLELNGLHFHLGSQVMEPDQYVNAIEKTLDLAEKKNMEIDVLDIGGGYPVRYTSEIEPIEVFGEKIGNLVEERRKKLNDFELVLEPGRFLTAQAAVLVTRVVNLKKLYGRKVIIVDASEDMISIERHGFSKRIEAITGKDSRMRASIAGNLCHSGDWIVEEPKEFPEVDLGDLLVFKDMGAYLINHNITYNLRKIPGVFVVDDGELVKGKHPFEFIEEINSIYE